MIIRKLKPVQFERIHQELIQKAHTQPLDASYTVNMSINNIPYSIKIQPEHNCKLAILQALRIERDEDGPSFKLITNNNLLSSLLEILIYQGVG